MKKGIVLILLLLCMSILLGFHYSSSEPWELIKSGEVEKTEYLQANLSTSAKTIIYFTDKTTFVLNGLQDIPHKKINIYRQWYGGNGLFKAYNYKIRGDKK